jgi:hypothetical protein
MSFKAQLNSKVKSFMSSAGSSSKAEFRTSYLDTDLGADLSKLSDELLMKVCPTAVGYAATIVRQASKEAIRSGGGETLGMSRKTGTRNKWSKGPSEEYQKRRNSRSLGDTGGIIKKRFSRKRGGIISSQIVGPRYETGVRGKNFAHLHESKNGGSGAPNHKWWGKPAGRQLKNRPWLIPAARRTIVQQQSALKKALMRWDIDPSEVTR